MDEEGVAIVCSTLGTFQEDGSGQDVYVKHDDCLESLKDLQRYMRRDHPESRDVFLQLGKWNIVRRDIVPLIVRYSDDHELVLNCVKVLVFLTMPVDPSSHQVSLQIEYLQHFRAAILDCETVPVIMTLLEEPLQHLERGAPKEDEWKMLQLFLTLVRNLLAIPDSFTHHISSSTQYAFLKERLLETLFTESVMELVVALTQHTAGRHGGLRHDNFLILEILHHVLVGQRPEIVAAAANKHFKVQKQSEKSSVTLRALMHEERAQLKNARYDPALHTPFSGMFVRVAQDGTKTILTRTPHQSPLENLLSKPQIKRGRIKRVVPENTAVRPTNDHLQVLLKDFVNQFLASGYNVLMQTIKEDLRRERHGEAIDPVPFFQVVQFFTAYLCRIIQKDQEKTKQSSSSLGDDENGMLSQKQICGSIASTLDEEMFVLVRSKWCQYIDEAQTTKNWGPVATGVTVMKDMIHILDIVLKRPGSVDKEASLELRTARILLYKVFYDHTDTGIIQTVISLLKIFDIHKQPRSFLADLVEITHIVLRMLEAVTKEGTLRVLKKTRGGRKKVKDAIKNPDEDASVTPDVKVPLEANRDQDETGWSSVAASKLGQEPSDIVGTENLSTDNLGVSEGAQKAVVAGPADDLTSENTQNWGENIQEIGRDAANLIDDDYGDADDEEPESLTKEVSLDVKELVVRRFADNTIVRNYCWLLKYYSSNSAMTNYYVVRMLQRICEEGVLEPMLYQLSILQTFYTILSDKQLQDTKDHKFVAAFLTKVVRGFLKKLKSQPILFIEILFWKLKHECANISADYMIHNLKRAVSGSRGRQRVNIADALGDDEDSAPHPTGVEEHEGRRADRDGSEGSGDDDQTESSSLSESNFLSESQESQIKELFEKYKHEQDYVHLISQELDPSGGIPSKHVKRKLLHLGLLERHAGKEKRRKTSNARGLNDSQKVGTGVSREVKRSVDQVNASEGSKRKKSNLFTEVQDEELKKLFLRHGNHRNYSKHIAESFGGLFTPPQISRRLRTLGLVKPKPKSKLDRFLANVKDSDEDGSSDEENVRELCAKKPNFLTKARSLGPSGDTEAGGDMSDDDDSPLGSVFRSTAFPIRASASGSQDEQETNTTDLLRVDLRATIGRGARQKACGSKGKEKVRSIDNDDNQILNWAAPRTGLSQVGCDANATTSKSAVTEECDPTTTSRAEYVHDTRYEEDVARIRNDGVTNSPGLVSNLLDDSTEMSNGVFRTKHSPSRGSCCSSVRKRPQTEGNYAGNELPACETTPDGLRAWPNTRQSSPGVSSEEPVDVADKSETQSQQHTRVKLSGKQANSSDTTKHPEELANTTLPVDTTIALLSGDEGHATADGGNLQRKVSKRRRLAKILGRPQVSEHEGADQEDAGHSLSQSLVHQQEGFLDETPMDDGLNDF